MCEPALFSIILPPIAIHSSHFNTNSHYSPFSLWCIHQVCVCSESHNIASSILKYSQATAALLFILHYVNIRYDSIAIMIIMQCLDVILSKKIRVLLVFKERATRPKLVSS